MSLFAHLWSQDATAAFLPGSSLQDYLTDIKNLKFSHLFSTKPTYAGAIFPKFVAAAFRIFLRIAKTAPDGQLEAKLTTFVSSVLSVGSGLRVVQPTDTLAILLYLSHGIFMKENWVGPSYLSPRAANLMKENYKIDRTTKYRLQLSEEPLIEALLTQNGLKVADLDDFSFDKVKTEAFLKAVQLADPKTTQNVSRVLTVNGEGFNHAYKLLDLFAALKVLTAIVHQNPIFKSQWGYHLPLLHVRVARLHSAIMDSNCHTLKNELEVGYAGVIENLKAEWEAQPVNRDLAFQLNFVKVEFALSLLPFFEFKTSKKLIFEVMDSLGIEVSFTGKMGVRTKYQTFKVAQLVVDVNQKGETPAQSGDSLDSASHVAQANKKTETLPTTEATPSPPKPASVALDEIFDNILHEQPVIDDFLGYSRDSQNLETNVVLMALMLQSMKSHAFDDQQREKAMAYLQLVINNYRDYSVMVLALATRSSLEFAITRKMERAMLQFDQLFRDWHSKDFAVADRLRLAHTIALPSYIELISTLAQNYTRIACFMSAFGLYKDLGMHAKAVECLFLSGQKGQALDYVNALPAAFKSQPNILCILGDIHKDPSYYLKAVTESNRQYAPAFRALGGYHFGRKELEDSLEFYSQAVALNDYNLTCWMRMAYIHMEKGRVSEAITAYKKAVWINEGEGGAWTNLAILYRRQGKPEQAFDAIQKSVALSERNWFGWYNAVIISLENRNFSWYVKSCLKLAELDKPEEIKDFMVRKFPVILAHVLEEAGDDLIPLRQADGLLSK